MQNSRIDPKVSVRELTNDQYTARILAYQEEISALSIEVQDLKSTKEKIAQEVRDAEKSILSFRSEVVVLRRNEELLRNTLIKINCEIQAARLEGNSLQASIDELLQDKEDMIASYDEIVMKQEGEMKEAQERIENLLLKEELLKSKVLIVQQEQSEEEDKLKTLQEKKIAIESDISASKKDMREVYEHIDRQRASTLQQKEDTKQYAEIIKDFIISN